MGITLGKPLLSNTNTYPCGVVYIGVELWFMGTRIGNYPVKSAAQPCIQVGGVCVYTLCSLCLCRANVSVTAYTISEDGAIGSALTPGRIPMNSSDLS